VTRAVTVRPGSQTPGLIGAAGDRASLRFIEFFAANIRNSHTRRAYARAADEFLAWCASAGVPSIGAVQPVHVATWIEAGTRVGQRMNRRKKSISTSRSLSMRCSNSALQLSIATLPE
jgi:site-specific recombinase XerC